MRRHEREQRLGIDIGRVIMCPVGDDGRPDTSFLDGNERTTLEVPAAPDMFEVLPGLVDRFERRAWLVSKAGPRIERLTRRWLAHHRFSHLLLFGVQTEAIPDWVTPVLDWRAVAAWFSGGQDDELGRNPLGQPDAVGRQ